MRGMPALHLPLTSLDICQHALSVNTPSVHLTEGERQGQSLLQ